MALQPVFDLHCDLPSYLASVRGANVMKKEDIGAALPWLQAGGVSVQVAALFCITQAGSTERVQEQVEQLLTLQKANSAFRAVVDEQDLMPQSRIGLLPAIENASGFCEEHASLKQGLKLLEAVLRQVGRVAYIGLTHHSENRFGGGNQAPGVGLKPDGMALLDYLSGRNIAVDLAHTSDALAFDILTYLDKQHLKIHVLASHSNFREVFSHPRNLPEELAKEVLRRDGIVGINFFRHYVDAADPRRLTAHVAHGWKLPGGQRGLAIGADFFTPIGFPDPAQLPLFFQEHENAGAYPGLLAEWKKAVPGLDVAALAFDNAADFFRRAWATA